MCPNEKLLTSGRKIKAWKAAARRGGSARTSRFAASPERSNFTKKFLFYQWNKRFGEGYRIAGKMAPVAPPDEIT
jgi:hypothetical protein